MSHITNLLTKPSTLGAIAVAGSGTFYVGLKFRTVTGIDAQRGSGSFPNEGDRQDKGYAVKAGREGGGV